MTRLFPVSLVGGAVRPSRLDVDVPVVSLAAFHRHLTRLLPPPPPPSSPALLTLAYVDDEGDLVTIGSTAELQHLVHSLDHGVTNDGFVEVKKPNRLSLYVSWQQQQQQRWRWKLFGSALLCVVVAVAIAVAVDHHHDEEEVVDRASATWSWASPRCRKAFPEVEKALDHLRHGRDSLASAAMDTALQLSPNCSSVMFWTGRVRLSQGRLEDSLAWFQRSKAVDPHRAVIRFWSGRVLQKLGRVVEAMQDLSMCLSLQDQAQTRRGPVVEEVRSNTLYHLARLLWEADVSKLVQTMLRDALEDDPSNEVARFLLGRVAFVRGDFDAAYGEFAKLAQAARAADDTSTYLEWQGRAMEAMFK